MLNSSHRRYGVAAAVCLAYLAVVAALLGLPPALAVACAACHLGLRALPWRIGTRLSHSHLGLVLVALTCFAMWNLTPTMGTRIILPGSPGSGAPATLGATALSYGWPYHYYGSYLSAGELVTYRYPDSHASNLRYGAAWLLALNVGLWALRRLLGAFVEVVRNREGP